ncbi:MAG: PEP/pyruvate-binding domain-containing protein, partial [Thermodesulfobacteriota bacterium]|nr:PEP/pyruvate-binding domain-containing protein [Thermodesulfobacteriota bacterium]
NKKVIYLRFAHHQPLLENPDKVITHRLDAHSGFEAFSTQVHNIITQEGRGAYYVFDCLSDLLSAWSTDLMIGNFFRITCPYLFQMDTVAHFAILRNAHSFKTVARIRETTQVLIDVPNVEGNVFIHPLKMTNRYSPTMFHPHKKEGERFIPVTSSLDATRLLSHMSQKRAESMTRNLDYWDRLFLHAAEMVENKSSPEEKKKMVDQLCQIMIGRERRILALAQEIFSLEDLLDIKSRLVGTGYIGGKSAGMLIARNILLRDPSFPWSDHLEPHDSFYVGSDVFYTYLVENGWWKLRMEQKTPEGYFEVARDLRERMLQGTFPDEIQDSFWQIIEYFGQSPIIIRSSSLLEDAFGNAFAGKYESIFCVNQGPPEDRFRQFGEYVRKVFASTLNEDALSYRRQRGLDQQDEQMALLIQRVSGSYRKRYFFPDLAGVGVSHNTFVWKEGMDPQAGMLRLVFGLGTRAVNRVENDYPRVVALDAPLLKPHAGMADARKYSQHDVDVLNIERNKLETTSLLDLLDHLKEDLGFDIDLIGIRDRQTMEKLRERGIRDKEVWILTFDPLLSKVSFAGVMQKMLKILEDRYRYPVDIEFTINFSKEGTPQINLLQCRPLQTKGQGKRVYIPENIASERIFFQSEENFMGGNIAQPIRRIIYIEPEGYSKLLLSEKYMIARLIGKLNQQIGNREELPTLLLGPGRWGTTTPSLGVPVGFSEINHMTVIVELEYSSGSLTPELSFGTHFFQDLVETDIFYVAIFPEKENVLFHKQWMDSLPNIIEALIPEGSRYGEVIKVHDVEGKGLFLLADIISRKVVCFN